MNNSQPSPSIPRHLTLMGQFRLRLGRYVTGLLLLIAYQAAQYWFDTRLMHAIDAASSGDLATARFVALLLIAVAVLAFTVRIASRIAIFYAGRDAEYDLRRAFLDKLYRLGPSFYAQAGTGDLMSRATNDLTQVRLLLGFGVLNVINTVLALASSLSVMVSISIPLTLACMTSLPLLVVFTRQFAKRIFARTRENQVALGAMSNAVQNSLSAIRVVRAYGLEAKESERFEQENQRVLLRGLELARLRGMLGPLMQAISAVGMVIAFWYGGWLLIEHRISAGGLLGFIRASTRLTWPLIALGYLVAIVQRGRAAYQRLCDVFATPSDVESSATCSAPVTGQQSVEVRGLTYRVADRTVLEDIDLTIRAGERIALVGPTGSGKTTLARILARALPTPPGAVYLDGQEISSLEISYVRQQICYSEQVPFLFSTTVAQNLAFARDEAESQKAHQASVEVARNVCIDAEIRQLVHGYDTVVGERGIQLSGGQRQRVALGRALLSTSRILILDDPTSAVDVGTERALADLFAQFGRDRTLVIITHRISLASRCDRVVVLDRGRIVEMGAPEELARGSGLYRRFCEEQRLESELDEDALTPDPHSSGHGRAAERAADRADDSTRERALRDFHEESVFASAFSPRLYRELWQTLRSEWVVLLLAAGAIVLLATFGLMRPLFVRNAIDAAVGRADATQLGRVGLIVAGLALAEQALGFAQSYMTQLAGARALSNLRSRVFAFLHRLPIAFFDKQPIGRLTTRVTNDIDAILELFSSGILSTLGDLVRLVGIVALMMTMSVKLSLSAFAALPLVGILVLALRRPMRNAFRAIRIQTARLNSALNEQISGMAVVQAFDKMDRSGREFDVINRANRDAHLKAIRYESMQDAALETLASVALACMVLVFGSAGDSLGTLLAFQMYLAQFFEPLSQLTQRYTLLQSAMAGAERVFGLLARDERDAPTDSHPVLAPAVHADGPAPKAPSELGDAPAPIRQALKLEHVNCAYNPGVPVLRDVTFQVDVGEHVALVGPTGSGKSTIASLLTRLYEPSSGRISVMGKPIGSVDVAWLRRQFAVVPQDPWLFPGTLLENIAGSDPLDRERARQVLERMGALGLFERRLGGLDAQVAASGNGYSVGERQLVAFARALYRDAPILLLDEATASIDSDTEACLQRALEASLSHRTAVVIAHRLATIRTADRILVLQHGHLVESGTHQQLIAADGLYRRLVTLSSVRSGAPTLFDAGQPVAAALC